MKHPSRIAAAVLLSLGLFWIAGAPTSGQEATEQRRPRAAERAGQRPAERRRGFQDINNAVAVLHAAKGQQVAGTVTFTEVQNGVRIVVEVRGLKPTTAHGFHIHEFGDCSADDFSSAGGHYNPWDATHGAPDTAQPQHHAGDLGNLEADDNGVARKELVMRNISLVRRNPILGRAVVIHAGPDDLKTDPAGDSGARIACGVIGIAKSTQPAGDGAPAAPEGRRPRNP